MPKPSCFSPVYIPVHDMVILRIALAFAFVALVGVTSCSRATTVAEPAAGPLGPCDVAAEFKDVDEQLVQSLSRAVIVHDSLAVEWRSLVGQIRLASRMADRSSFPSADGLIDASSLLERAEVGLLAEPWPENAQAAGRKFITLLAAGCGLAVDDGFLAAVVSVDGVG